MIVEIEIDSLAYGGDGVGKTGDKVVFVQGVFPGDIARVAITEDRGSFLKAEPIKILKESGARTSPFCPLADRCGGCQWQGLEYSEQLSWKKVIVEQTVRRIGGLENVPVENCIHSPIDRGWRTAARYLATRTPEGISFGYHERRSHKIVDINSCPVASVGVNTLAGLIREELAGGKIPDIREITIRASFNHPSSQLTILTNGRENISGLAKKLLFRAQELMGVVHFSRGGEHVATYGTPYRIEKVLGKDLRVNERSFFQVNTPQTENLILTAAAMCGETKGKTVVDAYGGVGLFSQGIADRNASIRLYDLSGHAVADSIHNAGKLGFTDFRGYAEDTFRAVERIRKADTVIIDPPRPGLGLKAVEKICSLDAARLIYISCNPSTLARDLKFFDQHGYRTDRIVPVDMFPHTYHIETVSVIERK